MTFMPVTTSIPNEILLLLYVAFNFTWILTLYYYNYVDFLRKFLMVSILVSMLFSGNIIHVFRNDINIGVVTLINTYLLLFVSIQYFNVEEQTKLIKYIFFTLFFTWIVTIPLVFFDYEHSLYNLPNLIPDILIDRINYNAALLMAFYMGAITYTKSFLVVPSYDIKTGIGFCKEYFGRLQLIMIMQSIVFYFLVGFISIFYIDSVLPNTGLLGLSNIVINGLIVRGSLLLLFSGFVFYVIKNKKKE